MSRLHAITAVSLMHNFRMKSGDVDAWERVRLAIIRHKNKLGMTNREFGRRFSTPDGKGHGDQWTSNLLSPKQQTSLSLQELDEAARILKTTAAELVRSPYDRSEYLTPTEQRIVQALRELPPTIRDHFLTLAEYLLGVVPEEIDFLLEFRQLATDEERARVKHWTRALRMSREPVPGLTILPDQPEITARPPSESDRTRRRRQK